MAEYDVETAIEKGMKLAEKHGVTQIEGFGVRMNSINLNVEMGKPSVSNGVYHGVSFRVVINNNLGFGYTTEMTDEGIDFAIKSAIGNARAIEPGSTSITLPQPTQVEQRIAFDPRILDITPDDIAEYYDALREPCETSNLKFLGGQIMYSAGDVLLRNSNGLEVNDKLGFIGGGAFVLSLKGLLPAWGVEMDASRSPDLDWRKIGERTVENVKRIEGPKKINYTGEVPVIFEPDALGGIMGGLFGVLTHMLRGDEAYSRSSHFTDRLGEQIAVENFSFYDDGLHPKGIFSSNYDMEGVPSTTLPLIEKGVLKNYLLDHYYAQKMGTESNGKCGRSMLGNPVKAVPSIGTTNTVIAPGDATYEEMISETREGFSINNIMGVHMSDFASGRFSVTGSGHYIKNGEIKYPVQDISISGTIPDLLLNIDMIGKEQKIGLGSIYPHLRVSRLTISSEKMNFGTKAALMLLKALTTLKIIKNPFVAD